MNLCFLRCLENNFFVQIMENAEINNIIKIVGLQYKKSYEDPESLKSLRYGKIMIMTDQVSLKFTGFNLQSFLKCVLLQFRRF